MEKEIRTIRYDEDLQIEAYRFKGVMQSFPQHFHEYYVIGFIEKGQRYLLCGNDKYTVNSGDILLFNPGDNHSCSQINDETLDYRALNVKADVMRKLCFEITGNDMELQFRKTVVKEIGLNSSLRKLHQMIMDGRREFEKEELLLFTFSQLIREYGKPFEKNMFECGTAAEAVCKYMNEHYFERISLEQLCKLTSLSRAALLRAFAKAKGMSPYRYLESIRLREAKKLLEQGELPVEVAMKTGFSDQSHFTNFFKDYIGLTPKQYRDIFRENRYEQGKY